MRCTATSSYQIVQPPLHVRWYAGITVEKGLGASEVLVLTDSFLEESVFLLQREWSLLISRDVVQLR